MFKTYRNLKNLHSLYEQNFVLINKLSGELDKHNKFSFQVGNLELKSQVSITKKELSKFTDMGNAIILDWFCKMKFPSSFFKTID